jgi:hypothetical protein
MRPTGSGGAAPAADAARDPQIEQASRPLDLPNTTPGALAPSTLDDLEATVIAGAVRALRRRDHRQTEIAAAAGKRSDEGVIARRLATVLSGFADELDALGLAS